MTELIKKACSGNKNALSALVSLTEKKLYYFCKSVLIDKSDTAMAYNEAYNSAFECLFDGKLDGEQKFEKQLLISAARACRSILLKKDAKALKLPQNNNFSFPIALDNSLNSPTGMLISAFPPLQRYIFCLRRIAGFKDEEIAKLAKIDSGTMRVAFQAERVSLNKLIEEYQALTGNYSPNDSKSFSELMKSAEDETVIPNDVTARVFNSLAIRTKPIEKSRKRDRIGKVISIAAAVAVLALIAVCAVYFLNKSVKKGDSEESGTASSSSAVTLNSVDDITSTHYADIDIADYGTVTVALDGNSAPETVNNFVTLADDGFYNGLTFHRIIDGFMIQGGDPSADGTGGSGNNIKGEFSANGFKNNISHTRGAISMARSSDYDSASSQFFIVQSDSTHLDGSYAAFGFVTEGMDIVDKICDNADPEASNGLQEKSNQPIINSITVRPAEN